MSFISQFFNTSMASVKLIGQVDEFKGVWSLLGHTLTDHFLKLQRDATVETIGSSMRLASIQIDNKEINTLLAQTHPLANPIKANQAVQLDSKNDEINTLKINTFEFTGNIDNLSDEMSPNSGLKVAQNHPFWPSPEDPVSDPKSPNFFSSTEYEALGYFEALQMAWELSKQPTLSVEQVRQLHETLMSKSPKDKWHSGKFKISANNWKLLSKPESPKYFETTSTADTPERFNNLMDWLNAELETERTHPLIIAAVFCMTFLEIHPFQDGNGRMSRILTKLLLWRGGYQHVKYSSLDQVLENHKQEYYYNLEQTLLTLKRDLPDWEAWLQYFLKAMLEDAQLLNQKLKNERKNFSPLPQLAAKILDMARAQGKVTIGEVIKATQGNRNTLKLHFKTLVAKGMLVKHGQGAGVWYHLS
jgi:Fic family protein